MNVPLVDLKWQHQQVEAEINAGLATVMGETAFVLGQPVADFEAEYAKSSGVPFCVGVANGTDALELSLRALGIGSGDEVIVPANTFIASALAIVRAGATPVLVDCDERYLLIDPELVARAVTPRTRAIMPVHLFGQMAPMEALEEIARSRGIFLVEDAAQTQGARRNGKPAGAFGAIAGTSFYPGKNLGAYGDAGAVLTTSEAHAKKIRALRNYGSEVKYHHPQLGFNSRLDTMQAVVLLAKLKHLAEWNELRRVAARRYDELLRGNERIRLPKTMLGNEHLWHLYVVRVSRRDEVMKALHARGIGAGIHYPTPLHLQGAFKGLGHSAGAFPVTEAAAAEMISIPMYPGISVEQQQHVARTLVEAVA